METNDNSEEVKVDEKDKNEDIKSNAVVKFSAALVPAPYTILQLNTDLNLPPSNWLSNSVAVYGVPPRILTRSGFSSFAMAHKFPDCVGVVDVVSDAENIKRLLKMSSSTGPISLLVHRVENTLLIDEFDINKIQFATEGLFAWFRHIFDKSMQVKPEKGIDYKNMSRTALQQKSLASKFLYHSLVPSPDVIADSEAKEEFTAADPNVAIPLPFNDSEPPLPEPKIEEELPDPTYSHNFARNVVWNFEDIQMLVGTDIPIFGGGTHPCISLRLRDMSKPINVLTGMDYWLDNLMCNVPEVVMCYHLNGIVQKYELIKTEDLPHLPHSKFSTKVIRDIAQNILSFLKANATKSGHTYWLFKGRDDDVVKLYDLSSLCSDVLEEGQTPFTVPVAMLLYRVARNMKHHRTDRHNSTMCKLLKNCISLLPPQKYPEIETSAHYMLADIYVPSNIDPAKPDLTDCSDECESPDDSDQSDEEYLAVRSLSLSSIREPQVDRVDLSSPHAPSLSSDVITRCCDGLQHVINGLQSLLHVEPEEAEMAVPSDSIPMSYTSLKSDKTKKDDECTVTAVLPKMSGETVKGDSWSWDEHLKTLLYDKAALIFLVLAEHSYNNSKYGDTLRNCSLGMQVFKALTRLRCKSSHHLNWESSLYTRAGDALVMLVTRAFGDMSTHDESYRNNTKLELELKRLMLRDCCKTETPLPLPSSLDDLESELLASVACYSRASEVAPDVDSRKSILRRVGNVENEIGVYYMNQALVEIKDDNRSKKIMDYVKLSQNHLNAGISAFLEVGDKANLALLHSNCGKLMRLRAHIYSTNDSKTAQQERLFYKKAITSYEKALDFLGSRATNPNVWDPIYWELSTTYYTMASLLQDYPIPYKDDEEAEREVTELLHKALKYCDVETSGVKLPVYELRCAKVHHRLASLHHRQFRLCTDEQKKKHALQLCRLHFEKAARLFLTLERSTDFLTVQMERVGLSESLVDDSAKPTVKTKYLIHALERMIECQPILQLLCKFNNDTSSQGDEHSEDSEQCNVMSLMLQRLQFILLSLIKNSLKNSKEDKASTYKKLYSTALKCSPSKNSAASLASCLAEILTTVQKELDLADTSLSR